MKKRILTGMLCVLLLLAGISCRTVQPQEDARPSVVVTIFPQYDFARGLNEAIEWYKANL